ncbi:hypothetical protein GCM10009678_29980 [Actinomadura kijaniata]|uniref:Uncharacterized protein n=1 Tax=Actinomadura namibiensis TaxID=182080 RepID=A0A7W3LPT8_ACTNM|nr:hypothetical protein [Actinomadura namibiensis]MBA8952037.1 hypothetical protein [Actinomadura namibiensis]
MSPEDEASHAEFHRFFEGRKPVFEPADGAVLRNVVLGASGVAYR